ncbi:tyrosine-protein phosphatase [Sphingomonas abietis]|uniref:tyrosine-protein phosphatase n=1 Tax=Sphingomonas abietis TaxID=3012344 RepID=UPI00389A75D5
MRPSGAYGRISAFERCRLRHGWPRRDACSVVWHRSIHAHCRFRSQNVRDLGHYRSSDGRTLCRALLCHSRSMQWLRTADRAHREKLGIRTVGNIKRRSI